MWHGGVLQQRVSGTSLEEPVGATQGGMLRARRVPNRGPRVDHTSGNGGDGGGRRQQRQNDNLHGTFARPGNSGQQGTREHDDGDVGCELWRRENRVEHALEYAQATSSQCPAATNDADGGMTERCVWTIFYVDSE